MFWARLCKERQQHRNRSRSHAASFRLSGLAAALLAFAAGIVTLTAQPVQANENAVQVEAGKAPIKGARKVYHVEQSEDRIDVQVTLHKSETIRVGVPFSEALVGNADVADVVPLTNRSIYIVGKQVGVTRLALLDQNKQMIGMVDVEVTYDLDGLRARMTGNSALSGVVVQSVNGRVLLTGVVPDAVAMQHAMTLAKQVSESDVTNAMRVAAPQQVMLEVRFVEANRSASRAFGVNASVANNNVLGLTGVESFSTDEGSLIHNLAAGLVTDSVPFGSLAASVVSGDTSVDLFIKALEEKGLARRLAEPNLVALSGDTASFLAGGEFPFPASAKDGEVKVEFKKFGIGLAFTPTVLNDGQINLIIEPEVSELDPTRFITVAEGIRIPTLVVRRASTTIELRDGQSFAIAGLLQSNHIKNHRQLPWLGDVPILGALLRSAAWQKQETDLVIIVTPRLIKPRAPGEKLATPLDKRAPTNEKEFFLTGRHEVNVGQPDYESGHILDLSNEETIGSWKGVIK